MSNKPPKGWPFSSTPISGTAIQKGFERFLRDLFWGKGKKK